MALGEEEQPPPQDKKQQGSDPKGEKPGPSGTPGLGY